MNTWDDVTGINTSPKEVDCARKKIHSRDSDDFKRKSSLDLHDDFPRIYRVLLRDARLTWQSSRTDWRGMRFDLADDLCRDASEELSIARFARKVRLREKKGFVSYEKFHECINNQYLRILPLSLSFLALM